MAQPAPALTPALPASGPPSSGPPSPSPSVSTNTPASAPITVLQPLPLVVNNWDEGIPPPDGYELDSSINARMLGAGLGMFVAGYGASVITAAGAKSRRAWTPLYIPVVGPFMAVDTLNAEAAGLGLLIADGILQAAGAVAIGLSFVDRRYRIVQTASLEISPIISPKSVGVSGRF